MDILDFFQTYPKYLLVAIGLVSLLIGSFLNVVIYRLPLMLEHDWSEECRLYLGLKPLAPPKKLNLYLPLSHCPSCKNHIRPWHNIPILSYFLLRGHCASCKAHISIRYPLVEALTACVSVYVTWKFGLSLQTAAALLFSWITIALIFIDLDHYILPDSLTLLLLWLGLFFSIFNLFCDAHSAIIGAIAGYSIFALTQIIFKWCTGRDGMGQGDFKFLAAIASFTGWQMLPLILLLASISGIIFALTHMLIKRQFKSTPLPFGPYLAVAGWIALMWGPEIMQFYLKIYY
jgi:leader peptidase (prepilin peptidase) / N-methyltransferase